MSSLEGPLELAKSFADSIVANFQHDSFWQSEEMEMNFAIQFPGLLNLYIAGSDHKQLAISAVLSCYKRLDVAFVRRECLRLVSLACWKCLSEERREYEFDRNARLRELWKTAKLVEDGAFLGLLIEDCIESGDNNIAELIKYCLLQWPSRRYLAVLLDDKCFVIKCTLKRYSFAADISKLLYGTHVYDPASEKSEWTFEDFVEDYYERIEQFQLIVYDLDPHNILATASLSALSDPEKSTVLLKNHLNDSLKSTICESFGWPNDENLIPRLAHSFSRDIITAGERNHSLPELSDTKLIENMESILLPMTLQYLNRTDYLNRMVSLLRFNFTKQLDKLLTMALQKCKPAMDTKLGLVFDGWFRYSTYCHHVEGNIYQFTLPPNTSDGVLSEWKRLKIGDHLYLSKLVVQMDEKFNYEYARVAQITGIVKESRSNNTQQTKVISESGQTARVSTKLLFTLDRQIEDVNFVIRMDPKDNSLTFIDTLNSIVQQETLLSTNIEWNSILYGQKSGTVSNLNDWLKGSLKFLMVQGPPNSGKTTALVDIIKSRPESKILIIVPTAEQADLFAKYLMENKIVDQRRFVRLGYSPLQTLHGRVAFYLEERSRLLALVDDYLDSLSNANVPSITSCEAAISFLDRCKNLDDKVSQYLEQLKQLVPLEYIQNEDQREAYLFKYHANVSLMTFGYAAVNAKLLSEAKVDFILMDDCNLVSELMTIIPLCQLKCSPRMVLFGDALVEPVGDDEMLRRFNFGSSLFSRMSLLDCLPTVKLDCIYNVPKQLEHHFNNKFTIGQCVVDFIEVECDNIETVLQSKQNVLEAEEIVDYFINESLDSDCVCLTPFNAQCDLIQDVLADRQVTNGPQLYTFDKFSGSHAKIVLCSLVLPRLNSFLMERLQMIFTRATDKLVIFHSPQIQLLNQNE